MFLKYFKIWALILKIAIKRADQRVDRLYEPKSAQKRGPNLALILVSGNPDKSAKNEGSGIKKRTHGRSACVCVEK